MERDIVSVILVVILIVSGVTLVAFTQITEDDPNNIILPSTGDGSNDHVPILFPNVDDMANDTNVNDDAFAGMKRFDSYQDVVDYLNISDDYDNNGYHRVDDDMVLFDAEESVAAPSLSFGTADGVIEKDSYSSTNNQVSGVEEGDRVMNDGEYAYIISNDRASVIVMDVVPAKDAKIISVVTSTSQIQDIYLSNGKLVIIGQSYYFEEGLHNSNYQYSNRPVISVQILDVNDRIDMTMVKNDTLKGNYLTSRMIDDHLYLISNLYGHACIEGEDRLPIPANKTYYIDDQEQYRQVTSFMTINIDEPASESRVASIMMSSSNNIYVSRDNIFITHPNYQNMYRWNDADGEYQEKTIVHRLAIDENEIIYAATGEVPGTPLNRYSMDEYDGHFRMATSTGWMDENQVYVLNESLDTVGSVENIAPGERIYSARFMGEKLYLVTFRQVDPFYVIDLSDPTDPQILGELKIPGYSDYLHPYDDNHIMGLGKEGSDVKLSLFDVTNVSDPIELDKIIIEGSWSNSEALNDPHAFLFSREKNMLVIPMDVYNYDDNDYYNSGSRWAGSYVFDISVEDGISIKAKISHELPEIDDDPYTYDYYYQYNHFEQAGRAFYIDNVLYTVSYSMLRATSMDDYDAINTVYLIP